MASVRSFGEACVLLGIGFAASLNGAASGQELRPGFGALVSPDGVWVHVERLPQEQWNKDAWIRPNRFEAYAIDMASAWRVLTAAPMEFTPEASLRPVVFYVPTPEGGFAPFACFESPIMEPALAAKFPEIRTFAGQGIDDPAACVRLDLTPQGFHAQVLSPEGAWWVDPFSRGDTGFYTAYRKADLTPPEGWTCETVGADDLGWIAPAEYGGVRFGEQLRTYRLANAATGEYTQYHGGTKTAGMAAITTAINRVNQVYEVEVAIRMILVGNNDLIVYTNPATDPYTNNNGGTMLGQNQSTCDSIIGSANYDIGHVFSTGGGGVAYLACVCKSNQKARGVTGLPAPTGDGFYIDYVAHEMGHQFGANHCFNSSTSGCNGNRNGSTAYEPGSASTIMGYAGLCGADNIQNFSDPYFTSVSFDEIRNYTVNSTGNGCAQKVNTGNLPPTVSAGQAYAIPVKTPFTLTASGSDPDGDAVTFCWEQRDLGPTATLTTPDDGKFPLVRSRNPTSSPSRTFPILSTILANQSDKKERLPDVARQMKMRVTARDNRAAGGGITTSEVTLNVIGTAGPFDVIQPAAGATWSGEGTVTWNVANTTAAPINCSQVRISLSTDGGQTFPYVLAASTPNDGSETVALPQVSSSQARIKVEAVGNVFFDISPGNFTVQANALVISIPGGPPSVLAPGVETPFDVSIENGTHTLDPATPTLWMSVDGGQTYTPRAMNPQGGSLWLATFSEPACQDDVRYYLSAKTTTGLTVTHPAFAPAFHFTAVVGENAPFFTDNFETNLGWTVSGTATSGHWVRAVPGNFGFGDPPSDSDGSGMCYVTGNAAFNDVNAGSTILTSPVWNMADGGAISYDFWLSGFPGVPFGAEDGLAVEVATDAGGSNWTRVREYNDAAQIWRSDAVLIGVDAPASTTVRVRFVATDDAPGHVVEAGIDRVVASAIVCEDPDDCPADFNGDTVVNTLDVLAFLNAYTAGDPNADFNGDTVINTLDVLAFLNAYTAGCP
ncbi:MAG: hypothetical protein DYG93_05290 [Leptolyngbya sp. PLA2]|nr:hypothetical protein [Leptolyngbya sp.]MCE7971062.1 hypothetical protein [Leptolyngbya sp. PL-A2]MCZ7631865.1 M12 family metallo-peptidase [Phycisphaerales bacterium]MDL1905371.1 hypothetical protein [Synechococcales cyanobacterium CNB]GIK20330.1 MAG: hypothetical protein BroJett004_24940 [Planctomycetota bacterium]